MPEGTQQCCYKNGLWYKRGWEGLVTRLHTTHCHLLLHCQELYGMILCTSIIQQVLPWLMHFARFATILLAGWCQHFPIMILSLKKKKKRQKKQSDLRTYFGSKYIIEIYLSKIRKHTPLISTLYFQYNLWQLVKRAINYFIFLNKKKKVGIVCIYKYAIPFLISELCACVCVYMCMLGMCESVNTEQHWKPTSSQLLLIWWQRLSPDTPSILQSLHLSFLQHPQHC